MAPDDRLPRSALSRSVHLDAIAKSFGAKVAVDLTALTIAEGEFLTLLGPSGCGKTTLLMIIAGFLQPDRGTIRIGERDITALAPEKRNFGMVFQGYALFPHLSVRENVAYPLRRRGLDKTDIAARVNAILEKVQLSALAGRLPRQLSGGQQQRVALARAIVFAPDMVLLDEPLSALDTGLRHDLQVELKTLHRQTGMTFVCVTHDQDEALSMSDRIAVMRDGRIVQLATPQELYNRPKSRFVANFMGAKNIVRATVTRVDGDTAICAAGEITLVQKMTDALAPGAITLALRPESLVINDASRRNQVGGTVEALSYVGLETVLTVASPLGVLTVRQNSSTLDRAVTIGAAVSVGWTPDAAMVVEDD